MVVLQKRITRHTVTTLIKNMFTIPKQALIGDVRKRFARSAIRKEVLRRATSDVTGPRGGVMYDCAHCNGSFKPKEVHVDHIDTVIDLDKSYHDYTLEEIILRIFCMETWDGPVNWGNLQVLCTECHDEKTNKEKARKAELRKKKK